MRTYDKDNKNYTSNTAINWNDVIKHDVRSIDDADSWKGSRTLRAICSYGERNYKQGKVLHSEVSF